MKRMKKKNKRVEYFALWGFEAKEMQKARGNCNKWRAGSTIKGGRLIKWGREADKEERHSMQFSNVNGLQTTAMSRKQRIRIK